MSHSYETEETKTSSMYVGRTKTVQEGVNGERQITELVTYIDHVAVSTDVYKRQAIHYVCMLKIPQ